MKDDKSMRTESKRQPAFDDTARMTFGKYKGEPLSDVPASYFRWLWTEASLKDYSKDHANPNMPFSFRDKVMLANYIWNSQDALASELGDTFI